MDDSVTEDFRAVYAKHLGEVRCLISSLIEDADTAEDLTLETFVNAYHAWESYQADPSIPVSEWLAVIAHSNVAKRRASNVMEGQ